MNEDINPQETREWLEALDAVVRHEGPERASYLLLELAKHATENSPAPCPLLLPRLFPTPSFPAKKRLCPVMFLWSVAYAHSCAGTPWPW